MVKNQNGTGRRSGGRVLWVIGAIVLVVAAAWVLGSVAARRQQSPEAVIHKYQPSAAVNPADLLTSIGFPGRMYPTWGASTDSTSGGVLYVLTESNPFPRPWWANLVGLPSTVRVGVFVDDSYVVQGVDVMSPLLLPGAPSDLSSYLENWRETSLYTIATTTGGIQPAGGGALGKAISASINDLAASIYTRDLGAAGLQRLIDQAHQITIGVRDTFPYFVAKAADGSSFNINSLKGRKFVVAFTRPTCGSCYEETMKLLNTIHDKKYDITSVVFIFGGQEFAPVQQFMREAPSGTILIPDDDASIAATIHQTLAPYAVLVDENMQVKYSGSANSPGPIDDLLKKFAEGAL